MAKEFDNKNRGSLWKNENKSTDSHPDFRGSLNVNGVEYWVSGWKRKEGANPKSPALSFSIQEKDAEANKPTSKVSAQRQDSKPNEQKPGFDDFEDDDPW